MTRLILCFILCYALTAMGEALPSTRSQEVPLHVDFQGVWTNPNASSKVPSGAARYAENLVNPRPGVASAVAGQESLAGTYSQSDERLSAGITYDGFLIEHTSGATPRLYRRDPITSALTLYSTAVSPPDAVERLPMDVAGERLYMATSTELKMLDGGATSAIVDVEMPQPLLIYNLTDAGGVFFSQAGESVAYRYLISRRLADGTYRRSVPSGRATYTSAGTEDVQLALFLPEGLVSTDRIEVYRTGIAPPNVGPGDTMYLIAQFNPDANVLAGTSQLMTFVDATPDVQRGEALYTNAAQGGISRQNERPPLARQLIAFDDYLALANVKGPERFVFRMIGTPANGDTIVIAGVTYTASTTPDTNLNQYKLETGGTVSENIALTAQCLVAVINLWLGRVPARTVQAYYMSGPNDPPGIIAIEAREVSLSPFTVQAPVNGDRFEPPLGTAQSSLATEEENGLWFSKRGQHYAFPPLRSSTATYRIRVGTSGRPILRVAKVRNNLIVFVDREGVWKVQRTGPETWRVDQINNNAHLLVPESVAVVDNQVIAWTTRGVVAIDETGVEEIDLPIKDQFEAIRALGEAVVLPYTFAVADEGRLRYILYHPEAATDTTSTHAWVYNADQGTWTERTDDASGGFVGEDDGLLYLGSATSPTLTRERTGTAANVYKRPDNTAIPVRLELTLQDDGAPSRNKQYTDFVLLTKDTITGSATFNFTNDYNGTESCTGSTSSSGEPFIHVWVPDGCQRTSRLKVDIRRNVLGQAFEVIGTELYAAGTYRGGLMR